MDACGSLERSTCSIGNLESFALCARGAVLRICNMHPEQATRHAQLNELKAPNTQHRLFVCLSAKAS